MEFIISLCITTVIRQILKRQAVVKLHSTEVMTLFVNHIALVLLKLVPYNHCDYNILILRFLVVVWSYLVLVCGMNVARIGSKNTQKGSILEFLEPVKFQKCMASFQKIFYFYFPSEFYNWICNIVLRIKTTSQILG